MFSLIAWIIVGAVAGWIASMIMNTDREMGLGANIIVGMIGSLVGGTIVTLLNTGRFDLFNTDFNNLNVASILVSIIGAVVLLAIIKAFRSNSATRTV
jgi:uncharacterized membrane protein YeaQ/YmgE (transglycosylase-associated protein family)